MIHLRLLFFVLIFSIPACTADDIVGIPKKISTFIENYFPTYGIESFSKSKLGYWVKLHSGPGLTFGTDMAWIAINGYGSTLSQFLMFDQLPPAIYEYLQETENLDNVYVITRDAKQYLVSLFDSVLTYRIDDSRISVAYG